MDVTGGMDISSIRVIGAAVMSAVMVSACGILPEGHLRREVLRLEVSVLDRRHLLLAW
ncbi:hypothetical protein [Archangium sp.]|uniref:hypothetical protein n=1 Tax=Archangium sp. TaxID=1872627 RepID=UPI002D287158|nr:hypothetical protein [Archangium sp.]HYO58725.1 hypothetical protein [Archangium sp.]